ncbi:MAG TPA: PVC-type heme-binding CxxCH protein, partial [Verrucomicrobiae bacterium]|nr:PVC-type heme-binding CxxCH protein [Verrucomicrobiae bacterium]
MKYSWLLLFCALAPSLLAQNGDKPGETQEASPIHAPPAPVLTAEQALKSFQLQPGFRIEFVASEPMIQAPVEIEFDPDGRLYVLEMRDFMRTADGDGDGDGPHHGRVSVLEDTDGDGRMDKSTVFVDDLLMPRAIAVVRGGLLVAEPPHLWFFQDTDGDGKADKKEEVSSDYGNQSNPEHNANGLLWARDNWIYSANHPLRYRNINGYWEKGVIQVRGQWGITEDDYGRLFFNSNSDQFRGDLVAGGYLLRNTNFKAPFGANVQLARDQSTFPVRVNPGVNRGYQKGTLRVDGTLAQFTAACAPCIYRGELFPTNFYGAAFVCEPAANLVRCNFLSEMDGMVTATNAFRNAEFLASKDERFRPVNLLNGPDGALYIVDMYHGIIQHKIYLTTYLRAQALSRHLEAPVDNGRIYRVLPVGRKRRAAPRLNSLSGPELVAQLRSRNGWTRDTAQQLLVEKRDFQSIEPLQDLAAAGEYPASIHALWALNAIGEINADLILRALSSPHPKVRATAVRVSEAFLRAEGKNELGEKIISMAKDPET